MMQLKTIFITRWLLERLVKLIIFVNPDYCIKFWNPLLKNLIKWNKEINNISSDHQQNENRLNHH